MPEPRQHIAQVQIQQIENRINPQRETWEQHIAPQLARADEQRKQAAEALAKAQEAQRVTEEAAAKKAAEEQSVVIARSSEVRAVQPLAPSGTCAEWMASAGVDDTANAMFVINRESGCNPNAVNPSSGACGIGQALPCSKTGCAMGDGECQMAWANQYAHERYGSWAGAAAHSQSYGWY